MTRRTVEDCLILDTKDVMAEEWWVRGSWRGEVTWKLDLTGEVVSSIAYEVAYDGLYDYRALVVYAVAGGEAGPIILDIPLAFTSPGFGGLRSWFRCPASTPAGTCGRRAGKLYLPPGEAVFACRECHRLTYTSCQGSRRRRPGSTLDRYIKGLIQMCNAA